MLGRVAFAVEGRLGYTYVLLKDYVETGAHPTDTEDLVNLKLDKATVTSAMMVPEGPAPARPTGPGRAGARGAAGTARGAAPQARQGSGAPPAMLPAHCRVQLVLKPSSDSLSLLEARQMPSMLSPLDLPCLEATTVVLNAENRKT